MSSRKKASDLSLGLSHGLIYDHALKVLGESSTDNSSLYDFGAGRGRFVQLVNTSPLAKKFREIRGIDLMARPEDLPSQVQWTQWDLNDEVPEEMALSDFVVALEVIEHLENPRHFVRQLFKMLKPGGKLLLSTPNNESFRSLISLWKRGHFVEFTGKSYPAHITALNRLDLVRITEEAGFHRPQWSYLKKGSIPGLAKITWQKVSLGWLNGVRFSDNVFLLVEKP